MHTQPVPSAMSLLEVLDATAATLQNHEAPGCPLVTATVNGNTLTLSCNGGRKETLTLHPGGQEGPVLTGRGGYFLPTFHPERWRTLAAIVPMTLQHEGPRFNLSKVAASLGFKVMTSPVRMAVRHSHELELLRLEHPDGREIWGTVFIENYPDGQVNDALILGGVIVARVQCDATYEDAALAGMSEADLAAENLERPGPEVFKARTVPLTTGRLQAVLNAIDKNTAHTLVFPELALGN